MLARAVRLILLHTFAEFRRDLPLFLACTGVWLLINLNSSREAAVPKFVLLAAMSLCLGVRRAVAPDDPRGFADRLPNGTLAVLLARGFALFAMVYLLALMGLLLSMLVGGAFSLRAAVGVVHFSNRENMAAFNVGLWGMVVAGWLRPRWLAGVVAVGLMFLLLVPAMWVIGDGTRRSFDGFLLTAAYSTRNPEAMRLALMAVSSTGWGTVVVVLAVLLGRLPRTRRPGVLLTAMLRTVILVTVSVSVVPAIAWVKMAYSRSEALAGESPIQWAFLSPDRSKAILQFAKHAVFVDFASGEVRPLESGLDRGRVELPTTNAMLLPIRTDIFYDVSVVAHVAYKAGSVDGWRLFDLRTGEFFERTATRKVPLNHGATLDPASFGRDEVQLVWGRRLVRRNRETGQIVQLWPIER